MKRLLVALLLVCAVASHAADKKKIVFLAGTPSHGPREHEFNAGCLLLQKCLANQPGMEVVVNLNGWPKDEHIFDGAAAVFIYCDGGDGHLAIQGDHLQKLGALMKKGVGLGCAHYGVEVPKDKGGPEFLAWTGGYFEAYWSVNPTWTANYTELPKHPITRGVHPFSIHDEWYFHMRFPVGMKGVTPILVAIAPESTMDRPDDAHAGNPAVRAEVKNHVPQVMMWATERPDGGRGFGFTGGHYHKNWANDDFRKLVLNAILWSAKVPVPENGVASTVTPEDLKQNLDPK
ncbi:MAG TPA: ThuA domain-containing protein [Verrucomicrobiae bacterium]|nr:ThuA domain-containing protein [Verrucomicrobiae bacterium]